MKADQDRDNNKDTGIDWTEVRGRLEKARRRLEHSEAQSPEKQREVLRARARELAREAEKVDEAVELLDILEFKLASETYAIESSFVREVHPLKNFTALPGTPPFVLGIVNVRGQILSVVDLKKFFNLPVKGIAELDKVIIIRDDRMEFGILADSILGTFAIPQEAIQPPLSTVTGIGAEYLKGITGDSVIVIDAANILGDEKIVVNQEKHEISE